MCLTVLLAGCAAGPMKPLVFPEPIGLQDPLPGMAVAYFLRIPNDYGEVTLSMGGEVVGTLPPSHLYSNPTQTWSLCAYDGDGSKVRNQ